MKKLIIVAVLLVVGCSSGVERNKTAIDDIYRNGFISGVNLAIVAMNRYDLKDINDIQQKAKEIHNEMLDQKGFKNLPRL